MTSTDAENSIQQLLDTLHDLDLSPSAPKMRVVAEHTDERPWGWIVYYQSERYLETGDPNDMLAGNGPYFVNRETSEMIITGTALSIEAYVQEYEERLRRDTQ